MSSRSSSWLPLVLMAIGLGLVLAALVWLLRSPPAAVPPATDAPHIRDHGTTSATLAVQYRPADSDWWLVLPQPAGPAASAEFLAVLTTLTQLEPITPALPASYPLPIAMAAKGALRLWQFAPGTQLLLPTSATTDGRWHQEQLADATLLFWLPGDMHTTAVDRIARAATGTGEVRSAWLQQRVGWAAGSCEALPAVLAQLPAVATLRLQSAETAAWRWQLSWSPLPATLREPLTQTAAPHASGEDGDRWFWREADLASVPRPSGCPATENGSGFVARLWQADGHWQAALARPGQQPVRGFPLPLPGTLTLQSQTLDRASALSSGPMALRWLQQQSLQPDSGLLLAIRHRPDGDFNGMSLQLQLTGDGELQLDWQWPSP